MRNSINLGMRGQAQARASRIPPGNGSTLRRGETQSHRCNRERPGQRQRQAARARAERRVTGSACSTSSRSSTPSAAFSSPSRPRRPSSSPRASRFRRAPGPGTAACTRRRLRRCPRCRRTRGVRRSAHPCGMAIAVHMTAGLPVFPAGRSYQCKAPRWAQPDDI